MIYLYSRILNNAIKGRRIWRAVGGGADTSKNSLLVILQEPIEIEEIVTSQFLRNTMSYTQ